jgi:hypothetical protein
LAQFFLGFFFEPLGVNPLPKNGGKKFFSKNLKRVLKNRVHGGILSPRKKKLVLKVAPRVLLLLGGKQKFRFFLQIFVKGNWFWGAVLGFPLPYKGDFVFEKKSISEIKTSF